MSIEIPTWSGTAFDVMRLGLGYVVLLMTAKLQFFRPTGVPTNPIGIGRLVDLRWMSPRSATTWMRYGIYLATVCYVADVLALIALAYLSVVIILDATYRSSFGSINHGEHMLAVVLVAETAAVAVWNTADRLDWDLGDVLADSRAATAMWWSIQVMLAAYFTSGLAKLIATPVAGSTARRACCSRRAPGSTRISISDPGGASSRIGRRRSWRHCCPVRHSRGSSSRAVCSSKSRLRWVMLNATILAIVGIARHRVAHRERMGARTSVRRVSAARPDVLRPPVVVPMMQTAIRSCALRPDGQFRIGRGRSRPRWSCGACTACVRATSPTPSGATPVVPDDHVGRLPAVEVAEVLRRLDDLVAHRGEQRLAVGVLSTLDALRHPGRDVQHLLALSCESRPRGGARGAGPRTPPSRRRRSWAGSTSTKSSGRPNRRFSMITSIA